MTEQSPNITDQIKVLEEEKSSLENKATHQGFRDASRRNRVEEQLEVLHETVRHSAPYNIEDPYVDDVRARVK